jgi:hypothetical protein
MTYRSLHPDISLEAFSLETISAPRVIFGVGVNGCVLCSHLERSFSRRLHDETDLLGIWVVFTNKRQIQRLNLNYISGFPMLIGFLDGSIIGAWEAIEIGQSAKSIEEQLEEVLSDYALLVQASTVVLA